MDSKPTLNGAFDDVRSTDGALNFTYDTPTTELAAGLARQCILAGLKAVTNCFLHGSGIQVFLSGIARATAAAIENDLVLIACKVLEPDGDNTSIGLRVNLDVVQNGRFRIIWGVTPGWISQALAAGSNEVNFRALAPIVMAATATMSMLIPKTFGAVENAEGIAHFSNLGPDAEELVEVLAGLIMEESLGTSGPQEQPSSNA